MNKLVDTNTFESKIDLNSFIQISKDSLLYKINECQKIMAKMETSISDNKRVVLEMSNHLMETLQLSEEIGDESLDHCKEIGNKIGSLETYLKKSVSHFTSIHNSLKAHLKIYVQLEHIQIAKDSRLLEEWFKNYTTYLILDYLLQKSVIDYKDPLLSTLSTESFDFATIFKNDIYVEYIKISQSILENHDLSPLFDYLNTFGDLQDQAYQNLVYQAHCVEFIQLFQKSQREGFEYFYMFLANNTLQEQEKVLLSSRVQSQQNTATPDNNNIFGKPVLSQGFRTPTYTFTVGANKALEKDPVKAAKKLGDANYDDLSAVFKTFFFQQHHYPQTALLVTHFVLGASALHSKGCHQHQELLRKINDSNKDGNQSFQTKQITSFINANYLSTHCPLCDVDLDWIKAKIPYSGVPESYQIYDNDTVKLPCGNVYDKQQLLDFNRDLKTFLQERDIEFTEKELLATSRLFDPISKNVYNIDELTKLYPL